MKKINIQSRRMVLALGILTGGATGYCGAEESLVSQKARSPMLFFEKGLPDGISTSANSHLDVSVGRSKDGIKSLKWDYEKGSTLTVAKEIGFKPYKANGSSQSRDAFATWIYNVKPVNDELLFQFGTDDQVKTSFNVNMNFQGWRAVVVPFETDMEGKPEVGMNRLTVVPPSSVNRGRIYFDLMALSLPVDPRWPAADYQVPYVNKIAETRPNAHWTALKMYDGWLQVFNQTTSEVAKKGDLAAIDQIVERIDEDLLATAKPSSKKSLEQIHKQFSSFLMSVGEEDRVRLRPVTLYRQLEVYQKAELPREELDHLNSSTVRFHTVGKFMLKLAKAYRLSEGRKARKQLAEEFVYLVKHLEEQGFARGSGQGTMHHQGYVMREWFDALFLMREVLGEHLDAARGAVAWYTGAGRVLRPKEQIVGFNVDVMNTFLQGILYSALMTPDKQQRAAYLRVMSEWMSYSMVNIRGLAGGVQKDGSFFHHSQHYVAYGNGGLNGLSPVVYYLSHTPFQLDKPAHQRLRKAVLMSRVFSNDHKVPMSLSGRHPDGTADITLSPFKYLTLAGSPGGQTGYDREIGQAYLRLVNGKKKDSLARLLIEQGIVAEAHPVGSWVMNYSSMAIHRRDDWLATARGFSRYLVGNETYANANHYGRYVNYGHLEILPAESANRGFSQHGWDWNRWPGTTTIHHPFEELAADLNQVDQFSGNEEMLLSDESYSGGNQLLGDSAMFAMKLHGHPKYDASFRARKSVFFFGDRIIALGSGIENRDGKYETETTLFQDHLKGEKNVTRIRDQKLTGLGVDKSLVTDKGIYLLDTDDNAYYLPEGQRVRVSRLKQHSYDNKYKKPTEGDFATALIEHGKAPKDAGYEYAILVAAGKDKAQQFTALMQDSTLAPYEVLQRDDRAHIVFDRVSRTTGYALFEANDTVNQGVVKAVDTPVMVIAREESGLQIALSDPDLNLYQGTDDSQYHKDGAMKETSIYSRRWRYSNPIPKSVRLTLKGRWKTADDVVDYKVLAVSSNETLVEVSSVEARPVQMHFTRM